MYCIIHIIQTMDVVAFKLISTMSQHPIIIDNGNPLEPKSQFLTTFKRGGEQTHFHCFVANLFFFQIPKEVSRNCLETARTYHDGRGESVRVWFPFYS